MTRASLLYILDHVSGISEAEIRELEQLATTFPYCQTAHVLLAKAAHDRGSMLASQRLRRAATYAADRQLLRQLLEQPAQEQALLSPPTPQQLLATDKQHEIIVLTPTNTAAFYQKLGAEDVQPLEISSSVPVVAAQPEVELTPAEAANVEAAPDMLPEPAASELVAEEPETILPEKAPHEASTLEPEMADHIGADALIAEEDAVTVDNSTAVETPESLFEIPLVSAVDADTSIPEPLGEPAPATETPLVLVGNDTDTAESDEQLPAVAPPIRPPAEAGISRFEFGLSQPTTPALSSLYQLPGVEEEPDEALALAAPDTIPPFRGDAELAYALLGGGSRLGYALQLQDGELTLALPVDEFFPSDALLQAHAIEHRPVLVPAPSSLDLINRFLKNQPRLKSPAVRLSLAEEQTDLSVRSTSVKPDIASESLAKIMIRQGKVDKAIEIYERLMVRQPEKSAYFADQIQQLQTPE